MFRLELRVQVGEEPKTLLTVCDGRYLWRCESYRGKGTAERIDLARASQARDGREDSTQLATIGQWPGLGGLPKLLRNLYDWFQFLSAEEMKLPDGTPVVRLRGEWRPDRLAALMPNPEAALKSGAPLNAERLPQHLPHFAVLFLGRDDLFPFRIEYTRRLPPPSLRLEGPTESTIVAMDLFEVSLHVPFNPSRFTFSPGNLEYSDQTERFLERLGLKKR
jgi:hypothetical protein